VTNLRSWAKRWNDTSLRGPSPPSRWALLGIFAIGLVAGAIGSYAVTQRSQIKQLAGRALKARREMLDELGGIKVAKPVSVTSPRSNHRRKAVAEVT